MNLEASTNSHAEKEESVEELIRKLSLKGTKVKIVKEGEEQEAVANTTNPQQTKPVEKRDSKPVGATTTED